MKFHAFMIALCFTGLTVGCDDGSTPSTQQGFTSCGDLSFNGNTCQPGQYCEAPEFGTCSTGCLSNVNCAANQTCDLTGGSPGTCINNAANPNPTPTGDQARCESACDALMGCGTLDNTQLAACKAACGADATAAKALADCVEAGADCNAKAQCAGGNPNPGPSAACEQACENAGFFNCEGSPALTPSEVATCKNSCATKSATEQSTMVSCWDAAFFNCTVTGARACFAGWL